MKNKTKTIIGGIIIILILIISLYSIITLSDEGEYNYCIEWSGMNDGTLHRDSLLFTCFSLATSTFYCDYEVLSDERLMIKPIINVTKNEEGFITQINYDQPNYFNCTRWLKSGR